MPGISSSFYLLRREVKRQILRSQDLMASEERGMEEVVELAQLRSKLKGNLRQVEEMVGPHLMDLRINHILGLKLDILSALEPPKTTHILHQKHHQPKARDITINTNISKSSKIREKGCNEAVLAVSKSKASSMTQSQKQNHTTHKLKPPIKKPPKNHTQTRIRSRNTQSASLLKLLSHPPNNPKTKNTNNESQFSTTLTIKISKQDYEQLIRGRRRTSDNSSDLLSSVSETLNS